MDQNEFAPVTPGEMLKDEFLTEYGLSQNELAKAVGISPDRMGTPPLSARSSGSGGGDQISHGPERASAARSHSLHRQPQSRTPAQFSGTTVFP